MKSICVFNNKGGVGKTTVTCNVASYLAVEHRLRVLLVDADPQCNSTQLVLGDTKVSELYRSWLDNSEAGRDNPSHQTLFDVLRPIAAGESDIRKRIRPASRDENRFSIDLLPGHPSISLLEDKFSKEWTELAAGDPGGVRVTNWNTQLCKAVARNYDLVFFDVGPSLGALNRSVLIGADFFMAPMGCDIFSIMGVANIASWLKKWLRIYKDSLQKCREEGWSDILESHAIATDVDTISRFIGYTVQQYITKSKQGQRRATSAYERILEGIPAAITRELGDFAYADLNAERLRLGDVPSMFSLVPLAQKAFAPIHSIEGKDGLVGAQYSQKEKYVEFIATLAQGILANVGIRARR